ncbi:MAG: hypothetical protein ACI9S8_000955 [Chlamydiales bacterium]|jgi:hypothetical protein
MTVNPNLPPCAICFEPLGNGDEVHENPCHHRFHAICAAAWRERNQTCATCRADVLTGLHQVQQDPNIQRIVQDVLQPILGEEAQEQNAPENGLRLLNDRPEGRYQGRNLVQAWAGIPNDYMN